MRLALALLAAAITLAMAAPAAHGLLFLCENGRCDAALSRSSCNLDCSTDTAVCGDSACSLGEDAATCASDCSGGSAACRRDSQCSADLTKLKVFSGTLDPATGLCTFTVASRIPCGTIQATCSADGTKLVTSQTGKCQVAAGDDFCKVKSSTETACANGCEAANGTAQCRQQPPPPSNRAPALGRITLTPARARTGAEVFVNSSSNDTDGDDITLRCGTSEGTDADFENSLNCQGAPAKINATCTFSAPQGNGDLAVHCRATDSKSFSQAKQAVLTLDNTKPRSIITAPPAGTPQKKDFGTSITDADNIARNLDKCFYRIEDNGKDTTFRDTPASLAITADNGKDDVLVDTGTCRDVTYRFSVEGAQPDSTMQIFFTDTESGTQRVTGTELRELTKCDGSPAVTSPPAAGSFADSRGQFILSFQTDGDGKGSGAIVRAADSADHGAYLYAAYRGTSTTPAARDAISIQDAGKELPLFWAQRACGSGMQVKLGRHCSTQSPLASCTIFAKANDTSGNDGEPAAASYPIAFISTKITAPAAGSTQGTNFRISVADEDLSGAGLQKCEYRVSSRESATAAYTETIPWTERQCNAEQEIPVKTEGCKDAGTDACQVQARATSSSGITGPPDTLALSIDFNKPVTTINTAVQAWIKQNFDVSFTDTDPSGGTLRCEYRVASGAANTKGWTARACNAPVTVTVGLSGDCRNEGAGKCTVFARSLKGALQSDEANESYNILLTQVTDEDGFLSVTTAETAAGLQFTAVPKNALGLPVFRICSSGSAAGECISAFSQQRLDCGVGKACLCGSLTGFSCGVTCSERTLGYYALATGAGGTTIVSPPASAVCPKTAAGQLDDFISFFQALDLQLTNLINRNDHLCRTGTEEEQKLFCPLVKALQQAQALGRDHISFLNSVKANPTEGKIQEAAARSETARQQILDIIAKGAVTTVTLSMEIPKTAKLNADVSMQASLSKSGSLSLSGKLDCAISRPAGQQQRATSQCLSTDGGSASISFSADQLGRWNVDCRLLASFRPDCSTGFEMDRANGTIQVTRLLNSTISRVEVPQSALKGSPVQANVVARNPDSEDVFGFAYCNVKPPDSPATARNSSCKLIKGSNQEETSLAISFIAAKAGKWAVGGCVLNVSSEGDCSNSQTHAATAEARPFDVSLPTNLVITQLQLPQSPLIGRETNATAVVENPISDRFALVSCSAETPGGSRTMRSSCEFINSGEVKGVRLAFMPDVKGLWNITACTVSSSNDACDTATPHQTVEGLGNFTVTGGRKLLIEQITAPAGAAAGSLAEASVHVSNPTDNTRFGRAACIFRRPDNTAVSNSTVCTRLDAGEAKSLKLGVAANVAGTWTLQGCSVNGSANSQCALSSKDDESVVAKTFEVAAESLPEIISVQPPLTVLLNGEGTINVVAENSGGTKFGAAACVLRSPSGQASAAASACAELPGGGSATIPVSRTFSTAGQWTVVSCSLSAGAPQNCAGAPKVDEMQVGQAFDVSRPNFLFIARTELPTTIIKDRVAQVNLTIENPLADNRFALVSCTLNTSAGTRQASNCTGLPAGAQRKAALEVAADTFGTWNLSECSVKSSLDSLCSSPADQQTKTNLGTFQVVRGTRLTAEGFSVTGSVKLGEQALVAASIKNPSQSELFARLSCRFRTPLNTVTANSSACLPVEGESSISGRVFMAPDTAGTWSVESCSVLGSLNPDCSESETHFSANALGSFTAASGPSPGKDLTIVSASAPRSLLRGEFAGVKITANNPAAARFAIASCTFRTPSGQLRTGSSQCAGIGANSQKQLVAQLRADEAGLWNVTSCALRASDSEGCSPSSLNDTKTGIGTFAVSAPTDLIISQITPHDTLNDSSEDITVRVENPIADNRFARVTCSVEKPSGSAVTASSACSLVQRQASRDLTVSVRADQIGTWNVGACSVFSSTSSDCSAGRVTHSSNGTSFEVSRPDKISFASGLSFPPSVQNGSTLTITSAARNPSASDIFSRMRCIFVPPARPEQNIIANSSCFVMPGEATVPVSVSLPVTSVGQWQIVSCSMLAASDIQCSDQSVHATNSTGGLFTSVGAQVNNISIIGGSVTATAVQGGSAEIRIAIANPNDFPQHANMECSLRNPAGAEENITSGCVQINASGTAELVAAKTVSMLGTWNATGCRVFSSPSPACAGAVLQNSTQPLGTFEVVPPTNVIIRKAFGNPALNASFTNITAIVQNPLASRKFALISCDVSPPSGANISRSICTGIDQNEIKNVNFSLFVDEVGRWNIRSCGLNTSNSFDCSSSQSNSNVTGGTFDVTRRTNLTLDSASLQQASAFINTSLDVRALVRNPSETDLFGSVSCRFSAGASTRQNSTPCTLFRAGTVAERSVFIAADILGTWTAQSCTVSASLNSDCSQQEAHDSANNLGSANVTVPPDLFISDITVPEGVAKNRTGFASVRVVNNGVLTHAKAACTFTSTAKTVTNTSACQPIEPGSETIGVPVFIDSLGNWTVSQCSVSGSADANCASLRLHNASNITRNFNGTGKTLEIEEVLTPSDEIRVGDRVEIVVRVRNVDDITRKGFVNCTLQQPNNRSLEVTSPVQFIPPNDTRLFRPSFIAEVSGQWRLRSCVAFRRESPSIQEDELRVDEIFSVFLNRRPPPAGQCSLNSDCPGTDQQCFCSGGGCQACPLGTTCRNHACQNIATPQCAFDSDCSAGFQCSRGTCIQKPPECTRDDQCLPGFRCVSQQCQKAEGEAADQTAINLVIIVIVAIIIAVGMFVIIKRKVSQRDIFEEIEKARK